MHKIKKLVVIIGVVTAALMLIGCPAEPETPPPSLPPPTSVPPMGVPPGTPGAAADDIVTPPGGFTYRANVHQQGQPDWPAIQETEVSLKSFFRTLNIKYRDYIETKAGETRNNIVYLEVSGFPPLDPLKISYEAVNMPEGINVEQDWQTYGGIGGLNEKASKTLLKIYIAAQLAPGEYSFDIKVANFGSIPCTVKVVESVSLPTAQPPGQGLSELARVDYEDYVELKTGETRLIDVTLKTLKHGPGEVNYRIFRVAEEYAEDELPMPEDLDVIIKPFKFMAYPNNTYHSTITIRTTTNLASGEYWLYFEHNFENVFEGAGWIGVNIE